MFFFYLKVSSQDSVEVCKWKPSLALVRPSHARNPLSEAECVLFPEC